MMAGKWQQQGNSPSASNVFRGRLPVLFVRKPVIGPDWLHGLSEPMKWILRVCCTIVLSLCTCIVLINEGSRGSYAGASYTVSETAEYSRTSSDSGTAMFVDYFNQKAQREGKSSAVVRSHVRVYGVGDNRGHRKSEQHNTADHKKSAHHISNEADNVTAVEDSTVKVILVTYFRGGSTFLGEAFNQNRDVFYWFEPLAAPMFEHKKETHSRDYEIDDEENALARPHKLVNRLLGSTRRILTCDIPAVDRSILKHYFATNWKKSKKFSKYQTCLFRYRLHHHDEVNDKAVGNCEKYLVRPCLKANIRVIKSIRLFSAEILPLLHVDPGVKLVYYVRDPRGILLSRFSLARRPILSIPLTKIDQLSALLCAKIRTDLEVALKLREIMPDRVILMRYEDLAGEPIKTLRQLYRFLKVELPPKVVNWIGDATHAQMSDSILGTNRANATEVAHRWQHELPLVAQSIIGRHCSDVIDKMYSVPFGYRPSRSH